MRGMDTPSSPAVERRVRRSDDLSTALRYLLATQRARAGLSHLCLCNDEGFLVAWDGDRADCEELAAYAPFVAQGRGMSVDPRRLADVSVHRVVVGADDLLLVLRGAPPRDQVAAMLQASIEGVARILHRA